MGGCNLAKSKVIGIIQLPDGILLNKTDRVDELLFRANNNNFFLSKREDGLFWIIKLADKECDWGWFDGYLIGRSQTSDYAFSRQENGNLIDKLAPCIESLIKAPATMLPEEFLPIIKLLGEAEIVKELEKLAVTYRR